MGKIQNITQQELKQIQDDLDQMMDYYTTEFGYTTIPVSMIWDTLSMSMNALWSFDDLIDDGLVYLINRYPTITFVDDRPFG